MNTPDYSTIKGSAEASFTEKKSEFIGYIRHVETDEEANAFIAEIRAMHRKATHNVYAYILRSGSVTRYSDDGEPQGTAGVPVFEVLRKEGLTDVCCVVTRYFGGILLGGGGLVRAYSHSAKIAVDAAERMIMRSCFPFEITADYNLYGKISNILPEFEVKVLDTAFTDNVTISLLCVSSLADALYDKLVDTANGRIIVHKGEEIFGDFA
ncbi:MAG: YigZ family protein [Oscillospiraceae bacterium]|nr:YigZ family protein [Oscillospiraceae bacterium]